MTSLFCNQGLSENKRPVGPALLRHIMHATERWGSLQRNPRKSSSLLLKTRLTISLFISQEWGTILQNSTEHPLRVETCLKPVCVSAAPTKQHHGIVSHMTVVLFTTCRPTHTLNIQSQICLGNQQYMKRHQGTRTLWDNTRQNEDHVMSAVWTTFWIFLNMLDSWTVRGFKSEYFNRPEWGKTRTNHTPFCVKYRTTTYFSSISSEELSWAPFLIAVYQTCTSILYPLEWLRWCKWEGRLQLIHTFSVGVGFWSTNLL